MGPLKVNKILRESVRIWYSAITPQGSSHNKVDISLQEIKLISLYGHIRQFDSCDVFLSH